ncbi:hypothetical protein AZI85_02315 [Bdellovibrio bacteriovorus]|uniref:Uncharacterized protein n=1 Tax=Bdellovibrio bacteriovorus TaxID=959 RepID=A0A150WW89_BDEBC|nr:hypothetical protein [Bdellovibrio bacteriovorus]KYG70785.1 hypothetical protein AZI85_02315 [Bdellovibrio bacteriovorus]
MKKLVFTALVSLFSTTSFAQQLELPLQPIQCISVQEAAVALNNYLTPLIGTVPSDDFEWADEEVTQEDVTRALRSLKWNQKAFNYQSTAVTEGYCAAGASCWGYYEIDCAGNVTANYDGE